MEVKGHNLGWQRGNGIRLDRESEVTHTGGGEGEVTRAVVARRK